MSNWIRSLWIWQANLEKQISHVRSLIREWLTLENRIHFSVKTPKLIGKSLQTVTCITFYQLPGNDHLCHFQFLHYKFHISRKKLNLNHVDWNKSFVSQARLFKIYWVRLWSFKFVFLGCGASNWWKFWVGALFLNLPQLLIYIYNVKQSFF